MPSSKSAPKLLGASYRKLQTKLSGKNKLKFESQKLKEVL